jgi:hypothetical protein
MPNPTIRAIVTDLLDCACSATQAKREKLIAALEAREAEIPYVPAASYYAEGCNVLCTPGDFETPSRFVGRVASDARAVIAAEGLNNAVRFSGSHVARRAEAVAMMMHGEATAVEVGRG